MERRHLAGVVVFVCMIWSFLLPMSSVIATQQKENHWAQDKDVQWQPQVTRVPRGYCFTLPFENVPAQTDIFFLLFDVHFFPVLLASLQPRPAQQEEPPPPLHKPFLDREPMPTPLLTAGKQETSSPPLRPLRSLSGAVPSGARARWDL